MSDYPHRNALFLRSATEALRRILTRVPHDVVYVPAYTCHTVVDLVREVGSPIRFLPLIPGSYLCAPQVPSTPKRAIVLVTHLYGGAAALPAPRPGLFIVEDAAQAFGLAPPSPRSDAVVWSFGSGKPVNLNGGGIVISNTDLGDDDALESDFSARERYVATEKLHDPEVFEEWCDHEDGWSRFKWTLLNEAIFRKAELLRARATRAKLFGPPTYLNYYPVRHSGHGIAELGFDFATGYTLYAGTKLTRAWIDGHVAVPLDPLIPMRDMKRLAAHVRR